MPGHVELPVCSQRAAEVEGGSASDGLTIVVNKECRRRTSESYLFRATIKCRDLGRGLLSSLSK